MFCLFTTAPLKCSAPSCSACSRSGYFGPPPPRRDSQPRLQDLASRPCRHLCCGHRSSARDINVVAFFIAHAHECLRTRDGNHMATHRVNGQRGTERGREGSEVLAHTCAQTHTHTHNDTPYPCFCLSLFSLCLSLALCLTLSHSVSLFHSGSHTHTSDD